MNFSLIMQCLFILVGKRLSFMQKKRSILTLYFSLCDKKEDDSNGNLHSCLTKKKLLTCFLNGQLTKIKLIESNVKEALVRIEQKYNFYF